MLMMRSTPVTKMGKPPPPVPPRPSKTLVAEALAKTRRLSPRMSPENGTNTKTSSPVRSAPPPPPPSSVKVNNKPIPLERSISEDIKCNTNTRTVIFQSPKIESPEKRKAVELKKSESFRETSDKTFSKEVLMPIKKTSSTDCIDQEGRRPPHQDDNKWDQVLNDRNHVNTLIDEMFASVLEVSSEEPPAAPESPTSTVTVVVTTDSSSCCTSSSSTSEKKKVQFVVDDRMNHELLISELESMRMEDEKILKRQRLPSVDIYEEINGCDKIQRADWVEVSDGQEVRLSSCQITIEDKNGDSGDGGGGDDGGSDLKEADNNKKKPLKLDYDRIKAMSSLHGLPPLPKSLSGFNLLDGQSKPPTPMRTTSRGHNPSTNPFVYPPHPNKVNGSILEIPAGSRKATTNLDAQLAILRREMYSLRQLDLSLLSQLWSLNESIQDFRQILQDQEDRVLSPPSPSPAPSSGDEGDADEFYMSTSSMNFRTPPPPPPVRRPSSSSNASSLG